MIKKQEGNRETSPSRKKKARRPLSMALSSPSKEDKSKGRIGPTPAKSTNNLSPTKSTPLNLRPSKIPFSLHIVLIMIQVAIAILLYFIFPVHSKIPIEDSILHLTKGDVRGIIQYSPLQNKPYASYFGLPYALPPLGERRFARPEPYSNAWEGIRDGTQSPPICVQQDIHRNNPNDTIGVEDCLVLNIKSASENRCPVIIWLHGGSYALLSGSPYTFNPLYFMDHNVIFIGINYRLGAMGFLTLETDEAPGNLGLRDQSLAIKWIRDEIDNLYGNKDQITLMGHGSGAHSALIHLVSPFNKKGTFTRIITQSGSPFEDTNLRFAKSRKEYAKKLAASVGCTKEILKCLRSRPADILQTKVQTFNIINQVFTPNPWVPVIDIKFAHDPVLPDYPENIVKNTNFSRSIPILTGSVAEEGMLLMKRFFQHPELFAQFTRTLPFLLFNLEDESVTPKVQDLVEIVKKFFIPKGQLSYSQNKQIIAMFTDMRSWAYLSIYLQIFWNTHSFGDLSFYSDFKLGLKLSLQSRGIGLFMRNGFGTCHGDELFDIFKIGFLKAPMSSGPISDFDKSVGQSLITMWINFARTGNPTPMGYFLDDNSKWLSIQESNGMVAEIKTKTRMI
ncbi:unnamed protein product [Lepeophtheirus salmonis]|uniref:(salmon louse) hypothetical protein n=1 Tax=Lepeophtheirus salmonis TaxID=72036 RepID=A0A7R8CUV0_LEPSM|nr:unnamed protein product [Lepeophtheirus salmonis]CAF2939633.1 unnamed protein product [Lepeophtheirus salmonis]